MIVVCYNDGGTVQWRFLGVEMMARVHFTMMFHASMEVVQRLGTSAIRSLRGLGV